MICLSDVWRVNIWTTWPRFPTSDCRVNIRTTWPRFLTSDMCKHWEDMITLQVGRQYVRSYEENFVCLPSAVCSVGGGFELSAACSSVLGSSVSAGVDSASGGVTSVVCSSPVLGVVLSGLSSLGALLSAGWLVAGDVRPVGSVVSCSDWLESERALQNYGFNWLECEWSLQNYGSYWLESDWGLQNDGS